MAVDAADNNNKSVESWTCRDVSRWLGKHGLGHYGDQLCRAHKIDGQVLLLLTEADLRNPPVSIAVLGDIKRIVRQIDLLRSRRCGEGSPVRGEPCPVPNGSVHGAPNGVALHADSAHVRDLANSPRRHLATRLEPEVFKTALSFVYVFAVLLATAFVMTVVHDRVPDMDRYPPLPDIVLDNVPYIPWAFTACEVCAVVLGTLLSLILILHKHRTIVLRRGFAITGTVFLLRCVTMFVTSLSVPGAHLQCTAKMYGTLWDKLERAVTICAGLGMSLTGVHTCGDYMFSGHTSMLTLANFFITEYSPRRFYVLHTVSWVVNLFGVFFLLAAHEHYSIDVFVAFYITSRLVLYYHSLANNRALRHGDRRVQFWFPMFSYFEANVDGTVPNEYEWPLPSLPSLPPLPWNWSFGGRRRGAGESGGEEVRGRRNRAARTAKPK